MYSYYLIALKLFKEFFNIFGEGGKDEFWLDIGERLEDEASAGDLRMGEREPGR